jgi:hypothetical protein
LFGHAAKLFAQSVKVSVLPATVYEVEPRLVEWLRNGSPVA